MGVRFLKSQEIRSAVCETLKPAACLLRSKSLQPPIFPVLRLALKLQQLHSFSVPKSSEPLQRDWLMSYLSCLVQSHRVMSASMAQTPTGSPSPTVFTRSAWLLIDHLMSRVCNRVPGVSFVSYHLTDLKYADDAFLLRTS